jgi:hypothetical protein
MPHSARVFSMDGKNLVAQMGIIKEDYALKKTGGAGGHSPTPDFLWMDMRD